MKYTEVSIAGNGEGSTMLIPLDLFEALPGDDRDKRMVASALASTYLTLRNGTDSEDYEDKEVIFATAEHIAGAWNSIRPSLRNRTVPYCIEELMREKIWAMLREDQKAKESTAQLRIVAA